MARGTDVKVGLFVFLGMLMAGIVIFLIGDERRLFSSSVPFRTKFSDVQGLKPGAPIRMGGIDIGHVDNVGYNAEDAGDTTIYVTLQIVATEAGRIKSDSVARIGSKGLLGDKMIEITKGEAKESVKVGGDIKGEEPQDMFGKVQGMADKAESTMTNIEKVSAQLANEKLQTDLRNSVASVSAILKQVESGDGYPNRFLTDKGEADRLSKLVTNLERTSTELSSTMHRVNAILGRVEHGPGFVHDVVYGEGPKKQIEQFGGAAEEVALTLRTLRSSDSFAHDVLFGGKGNGAEALANFTAMTGDLRAIVSNVRQGKGTVGALLVDPSVYEDLKVVLGNVQRNDVLRALVRYSIKQDEQRVAPAVSASEPAATPPEAATSAPSPAVPQASATP